MHLSCCVSACTPAVSHPADQLPPSWPQPRLVFSFPSESEPASSLDWVHRDFEKRGVSVGERKVQRGRAYRVDAPHTVARSMTSPSIRRDRAVTNGRQYAPQCWSWTFPATQAESKTPDDLHRSHGASAKLTGGMIVVCLSAWVSIGVQSGVCPKHGRAARTISTVP